MAHPTGESESDALLVDFDRRLMLQFRGSVVTSDAGLLAYRELDDALGLSVMAGEMLADARTGKNGRHALVGLLRQSVFGRLAGYEDVNDAERLRHDPAMRWIVGGKPAILNLDVAALGPAQLGEPFPKRGNADLPFWIAFRKVQQNSDAPHPLRLLRVRCERPSCHSAAKERNALASPHGLPPV